MTRESFIFANTSVRSIYGEAWSEFSATGDKFADEKNPVPLIQVGKPGDVGVAQFVDVLFTVADVLPGCKLVEVNMAGSSPGDVGFWNSHFRSKSLLSLSSVVTAESNQTQLVEHGAQRFKRTVRIRQLARPHAFAPT